MKLLNEQLLSLVSQYGLKAVVVGLSVTCQRKAQFEADGGEMGSEARSDAWEADQRTIDKIVPLIINDTPDEGERDDDFDRIHAQIDAAEQEDVHGEWPAYPREDWEHEVGEGDTNLGYWEWVRHQFEANYVPANQRCVQCDEPYEKQDMDGGRCTKCGTMICAESPVSLSPLGSNQIPAATEGGVDDLDR